MVFYLKATFYFLSRLTYLLLEKQTSSTRRTKDFQLFFYSLESEESLLDEGSFFSKKTKSYSP